MTWARAVAETIGFGEVLVLIDVFALATGTLDLRLTSEENGDSDANHFGGSGECERLLVDFGGKKIVQEVNGRRRVVLIQELWKRKD
jgi:hypothetical protein